MWFDFGDDALYAVHDAGKIDRCAGVGIAQRGGAFDFSCQSRRANQRFGGHAAGIQAVAAHGVLFNQTDLGLYRCGYVGTDQAAAARTDDHQVAIKAVGFLPAAVNPTRLDLIEYFACDQRK